jgi:hypothetical protein
MHRIPWNLKLNLGEEVRKLGLGLGVIDRGSDHDEKFETMEARREEPLNDDDEVRGIEISDADIEECRNLLQWAIISNCNVFDSPPKVRNWFFYPLGGLAGVDELCTIISLSFTR